MKDLAVIILGYNGKEFFPACLDSVEAALAALNGTVYVVDNASTDGTAEFIREQYPWCKLIVSPHNGGFSYGNNLGFSAAGFPDAPRYRYAMLLNPDTIVPLDGFTHMLAYMDAHPKIGVLGPRLMLRDGSLDRACKRGEPTPATSFYHFSGLAKLFPNSAVFGRYNMTFVPDDQVAEVDSTVGACSLYRSTALQGVQLMDESFFMYGEDLDLNIRIKANGYRVVYYPEVIVQHLKGASTRKAPEKMIRAFYDAMKIFHRKHYAARYPAPFNRLMYTAIDSLCRYKLWRNRRLAPAQRVVGSAKADV